MPAVSVKVSEAWLEEEQPVSPHAPGTCVVQLDQTETSESQVRLLPQVLMRYVAVSEGVKRYQTSFATWPQEGVTPSAVAPTSVSLMVATPLFRKISAVGPPSPARTVAQSSLGGAGAWPGQVLGVQVELPTVPPPLVQTLASAMEQTPPGWQQAAGCGQGFPEQVDPVAPATPAQFATVEIEHAPLLWQQATLHAAGVQAVPKPAKRPPPAALGQSDSQMTEQELR